MPTGYQACAVFASCPPQLPYDTDPAGSQFYIQVRSLNQLAPGSPPWGWQHPEVSPLICASPQVQNVHGAFNALGGADRLTSNRMYLQGPQPPAVGFPGQRIWNRAGEGAFITHCERARLFMRPSHRSIRGGRCLTEKGRKVTCPWGKDVAALGTPYVLNEYQRLSSPLLS